MYTLDVTHVVLRRWRAGVRGRIDLGSVSVRGHQPASGVRLVRVPPIRACYRTPGAKRVWNLCLLGREGSV